jgi:hypothetical protein
MRSLDVRERLVEALKLDLVGPWAGHALVQERLLGWVRPLNWYFTGFLIPSGTAPDKSRDADEDDDMGTVPESAGLDEESSEERKAAKKGYFSSSMGLSFLVPNDMRALSVLVRWADYVKAEIPGNDRKPVSVWQRNPHPEMVDIVLKGDGHESTVREVPGSGAASPRSAIA